MRLLYFVQYFPPETASGLNLVMDMLEGFAARGWDVVCYTPTPTRGVTRETRREICRHRIETRCGGRLRIHRMRLWREGTGFAQRTIRYCVFSLQCLLKGLFHRADAVFTGGGPPTQGIVAGLLRKLTRKAVIFNPQDLFPDSLVVTGTVSETSPIVKLGRVMERFSYRNADAVITISEDMRRTILSRCDQPERVHVVRNWIDTDAVRPVPRAENALFDELNIPRDGFLVTYAGNLGKAQGVDTLIDAAALLREEPVRFVLFGGGSEEEAVRRRIAELGLQNVQLFPLQPMARVPEVYSLGDVSCVLTRRGVGAAGMPSKTASILACGAPVLAAFDEKSELAAVLHDNDCGVCVPPEDPAALAEAIRAIANDPDRVQTMGKNARAFAERELARDCGVTAYAELIAAAVEERKRVK